MASGLVPCFHVWGVQVLCQNIMKSLLEEKSIVFEQRAQVGCPSKPQPRPECQLQIPLHLPTLAACIRLGRIMVGHHE